MIHYLYLVPLTISMVLSTRAFRNRWETSYRLFSLFLIMTFSNELFAILWKYFLHKTEYWDYNKSNLWIYNIYLVPQYLFYFLFFASTIEDRFFHSIRYPIILTYLLLSIVNIIFIQGINQLDTYTIIGGSFLVISCSSYYFINEINSKESFAFTQNPAFWIVVGSLVFHTASLPYFIAINYLSQTNIKLAIKLFNILAAMNVLMYSSYIIAFLCKPTPLKKSR